MEKLYKLFNDYSKPFILKNRDCLKKYHHSYRVLEYAKEIAGSINLNEKEYKLVVISSLLHDLGRYNQMKEYNTFNDLKSIDHGDESVRVFESEFEDKLDLSKEEIEIVKNAIKFHNKLSIDNIDDLSIKICKIIRDADKLDIIKELFNLITDENPKLNSLVVNDLLNKKMVENKNINGTNVDSICRQLGFVFDLNYKYSLVFYKDKLLDNKISLLKINIEDEIINKVENIIQEYIEERLKLC